MHFGSPEFVLAIIAMVMIAGVLKSWGRSRHGLDDGEGSPRRPARRGHRDERAAERARLQADNARLVDRLEASEDRLAVLERIITDEGYNTARQIEALRDRKESI